MSIRRMATVSVRRTASIGGPAGWLSAVTVLAVAGLLLAAAPASALPGFGTGPTQLSPVGTGSTAITSVSTGHHAGYDRLVFTFARAVPQASIRYVAKVTHDPSGKPVPLLGSAFLLIAMQSPSHSTIGTITPRLPMLRQVKPAGDFEAVLSFGVGLASRSGYRAFTLTSPARLVIDTAIPSGSTGS